MRGCVWGEEKEREGPNEHAAFKVAVTAHCCVPHVSSGRSALGDDSLLFPSPQQINTLSDNFYWYLPCRRPALETEAICVW